MLLDKILFPTDFGPYSKGMLYQILSLKDANIGEIILLHLLETEKLKNFFLPDIREKLKYEWKKIVAEKLEELKAICNKENVKSRIIMKEGSPRWDIANIAREENVTLIVGGSQKEPVLPDCFLDPNTELTIRSVHRPVLVFRKNKANPDNPFKWRRILYPTDFSDYSHDVLNHLPIFLKTGLGEIDVIHVQDQKIFDHLVDSTIDLYNKRDTERLSSLQEKLHKMGFKKVRTHLKHGVTYRIILEMIEQCSECLTIMGSRGKSSSVEMFFGSTAERIARSSSQSVLLI